MDEIQKKSMPGAELTTVDKLRMLLDITKTISRSLDLDEVLNLVMDTLGSLLLQRSLRLLTWARRGLGRPCFNRFLLQDHRPYK